MKVVDPEFGEIVVEVFLLEVASQLLTVPLVARRAGHKHLFGVVRDYLDPEAQATSVGRAAATFIRDFVANDTAAMMSRWKHLIEPGAALKGEG